MKTCQLCKAGFDGIFEFQMFCSSVCRDKHHRNKVGFGKHGVTGVCMDCGIGATTVYGLCLACFEKRPGLLIKPDFRLKNFWLSQTFGAYRLVDDGLPECWGPRSSLKVRLVSDSGVIKEQNFRSLYYGTTAKVPTPKAEWLAAEYGKLTIIDEGLPDYWFRENSKLVVKVRCSCGRTTEKRWFNIINGDTRSCGKCHFRPVSKVLSDKYHRLRILTAQESEFNSLISWPDEVGYMSKDFKVEVVCDCGRRNVTQFYDLVTLRTFSCGCALNESKSHASKELFDFVSSVCPVEALFSVKGVVPNREIDIWAPDLKLAIEYHGLFWHSEARRNDREKLKDYEKYRLLKDAGIRCVQIYSDEWDKKRPIFEAYLKSLLGNRLGAKRCKPRYLLITYAEASAFLDKHHYLSGNLHSGSFYIGAVCGDALVGVWVFKRRGGDGLFELTRASWDHRYKAYNPHSAALKFFKSVAGIDKLSVVSFSDNRLHTGDMYRRMGFEKVTELPPDYAYTNGAIRRHKFSFRVKAGHDERLEAASKNYFRIWDSGKTKWEITL